jgi:hypothetical protein
MIAPEDDRTGPRIRRDHLQRIGRRSDPPRIGISNAEIGPAASSSWKSSKISTPMVRGFSRRDMKTVSGRKSGNIVISARPYVWHFDPVKTRFLPMTTQQPSFTTVFAIWPGMTHLDFTGPHQVLSRLPNAQTIVASPRWRECPRRWPRLR